MVNILQKLNNLANWITRNTNNNINFSPEIQQDFLNTFSEPKDEIERSYFQYKCQMKLYGKIISLLINIGSIPLLIFYYFKKTNDILKEAPDSNDVGVYFSDGNTIDILPNELQGKYTIKIINTKKECFDEEDKNDFWKLYRRYPFSIHFLLKVLIKIRFYSYAVKAYSPKAIIVCNEYSFTSSFLTYYCRKNKIKHINAMHGEKLFFIRDSFFEFDECYVWDDFYIKLFRKLKAKEGQFKVAIPKTLIFDIKNKKQIKYDFKYFLAAESKEEIRVICNSLIRLKDKGHKICVRPHPRYSLERDIEYIKTQDIDCEDVRKIRIEDSILESGNVISLYSTILNQAFHNGVNIVIDDVSNKELFGKLELLDYIMLNKKHDLLSGYLT